MSDDTPTSAAWKDLADKLARVDTSRHDIAGLRAAVPRLRGPGGLLDRLLILLGRALGWLGGVIDRLLGR